MTSRGSLIGILALVVALSCAQAGTTAAIPSPTKDPAIKNYQALVTKDDDALNASTSNHCNTIADTGCPAAVAGVIVALQQWALDLKQFQTPTRFVTIDGQLQRHLAGATTDVGAIGTANQAQDQPAEDLAVQIALTELTWVNGISASIRNWAQFSATVYMKQVGSEIAALDACDGCGQLAGQGQLACTGSAAPSCDLVLMQSFSQIQAFQAGILEIAAPDSLLAKDANLQAGLAQADTALLALKAARLTDDQKAFDAARVQFQQSIATVHKAAAAI
jgi:hypothetical protein